MKIALLTEYTPEANPTSEFAYINADNINMMIQREHWTELRMVGGDILKVQEHPVEVYKKITSV